MLACQSISVRGEQWNDRRVAASSNSKCEVVSNPLENLGNLECGGHAVLKQLQHSVQYFCFLQDRKPRHIQGILCEHRTFLIYNG